MSQEDLTEKIGVSRQAVSKWETDEVSPRTGSTLKIIATITMLIDHIGAGLLDNI